MNPKKKVVVAMSGGIDSSVAAALLLKQGFDVIGMMLRLWSEPGKEQSNRCCAPDALAMARRVSAKLNLPFYVVDSRQIFHEIVVKSFNRGYAQGITPNPCLVCNRHIRWNFLLNHALSLGADFMATGHYARLHKNDAGLFQLFRAIDENKDQSYVLHVLSQDQLSRTLLPLGTLTKQDVRKLAKDFALPVTERPESQDLCFLGSDDYRNFLLRQLPQVEKPGTIIDSSGNSLGQHRGLAFYTIGQRKGLGISSPHPLYVLEKDRQNNSLIVGKKEELTQSELIADNINWISGRPPTKPFISKVKIRYKSPYARARVSPLTEGSAHVAFDDPLHSITPGQAAVFYSQDICLGGGIIQPMQDSIHPANLKTLKVTRGEALNE